MSGWRVAIVARIGSAKFVTQAGGRVAVAVGRGVRVDVWVGVAGSVGVNVRVTTGVLVGAGCAEGLVHPCHIAAPTIARSAIPARIPINARLFLMSLALTLFFLFNLDDV